MKNYAQLAVTAALVATLGTACDDGLSDLNENPNAPRDVPAHVILPAALQGTIETVYGQWFNLEFTGLFAQHWAKIQYVEEDQFRLRPGVISGFWTNLYAGTGANITDPTGVGDVGGVKDWQLIIEKGQVPDAQGVVPVNYEATGRTMKAFTFQIMTDVWGDIPYTEALQGDGEAPIMTPVYDRQQAIYAGIDADLVRALELFDPAGRTWGAQDLIYRGNVGLWMRFANSLRLRAAMRISDVDPGTARSIVEEVVASPAGLITANAMNATLLYTETAPNQNPLFENAIGRDDHAVSQTLVDYMLARNDPRLAVYAEPAASDGAFRGMPNGVPEQDVPPLTSLSRIGDYWRDVDDAANAARPALLVIAAEVHFLLAEAELTWPGITGASAQAHYEAGVREALAMYDGADGVPIDDAAIAAYLAQPGVAWGTGDSNLELVLEQKWLSLYTNGPEAYAEYRRTGFPDEITIRAGHSMDHVPGRIPYPDVEQSLNAANMNAALQAQNTDGAYSGKVWWDPAIPQ